MNIYSLIKSRRSIRKFKRKDIDRSNLIKYIDAARFSPQGMNRQAVKYVIIDENSLSNEVYKYTNWAGYFDEGYSNEEVRPSAYIALLVDKNITKGNVDTDVGIIGGFISLMVHEDGLGSCWLGAIDRDKIGNLLCLDKERFHIHSLIAIGYPDENPIAVEMKNNDCKYYVENKRLNVPKRKLEDITYINKFNGGL